MFLKLLIFFICIIFFTGCNNQIGEISSAQIGNNNISLPSAPDIFTITSVNIGNGDATIDWSNSANASSYVVKFKLAAAPTYTIASTTPSKPYLLTGLTNGSNYMVVIEAHNSVGVTESPAFSFSASANNAPVSANISQTFNEDTQSILTLSYIDADGDQAISCSLSSLSNVTITQACSCSLGVCTVGVTGTANYFGSGSFSYTVTANGDVSNASTANLTISSIDDAPVVGTITPPAFNEDTQSIITLPYTDVESNAATSCSVSSPLLLRKHVRVLQVFALLV